MVRESALLFNIGMKPIKKGWDQVRPCISAFLNNMTFPMAGHGIGAEQETTVRQGESSGVVGIGPEYTETDSSHDVRAVESINEGGMRTDSRTVRGGWHNVARHNSESAVSQQAPEAGFPGVRINRVRRQVAVIFICGRHGGRFRFDLFAKIREQEIRSNGLERYTGQSGY